MNIRLISDGVVTAIKNLEAIQIKDESIELIFSETHVAIIDFYTLTSQLMVVIEE